MTSQWQVPHYIWQSLVDHQHFQTDLSFNSVLTAIESIYITSRIFDNHGDFSTLIGTIHYLFSDFKCGHTITSDAEHLGDKIHGIILDDRRVKIREITEAS